MSVLTTTRVWESSQHTGTELLLLLAIADFADDEGNAYPAVATLARKCRMQPRNVQKMLARLKASGELVVRQSIGPKGANRYRIMLARGVSSSTPPSGSTSPSISAPLSTGARGGVLQCAKGVSSSAPKPSLNHHEPSESVQTKRARSPSAKRPIPADFAVSDGTRAWAASRGFDRLNEHLEAFVGKCKAKGYQYADWDAAFREAIREDWAGLRTAGRKRTHTAFTSKNYAGDDDGVLC